MRRDLVQKAVIIPVITGIILCGTFYLFLSRNISELLPFDNQTVIAYHDAESEASQEKTDPSVWEELTDNEIIGTIDDITMRYHASETAFISDASVMPVSAAFDQIGCTYIKVLNVNANDFGNIVTVNSSYGSYEYQYVSSFTAENEQEILYTSPASKNSMIIYYRISDEAGVTSQYHAMIYEEAV